MEPCSGRVRNDAVQRSIDCTVVHGGMSASHRPVSLSRSAAPPVADWPQLDAIVAQVREKNYGFRLIVTEIVVNTLFQSK